MAEKGSFSHSDTATVGDTKSKVKSDVLAENVRRHPDKNTKNGDKDSTYSDHPLIYEPLNLPSKPNVSGIPDSIMQVSEDSGVSSADDSGQGSDDSTAKIKKKLNRSDRNNKSTRGSQRMNEKQSRPAKEHATLGGGPQLGSSSNECDQTNSNTALTRRGSKRIAPNQNKVSGSDDTNPFDNDMEKKCKEELQRIKWIENFEIVHSAKKREKPRLEIVCKLGKVPHTEDIVKLLGVKILQFITYKEASKADWFKRNILDENFELKQIFAEGLSRLKWVENFKILNANQKCQEYRLEIVCKLGKVPCTEEIVNLLGLEILPYITYKDASKADWFEENVLDENFEIKKKYANGLSRFDWVESFEIINANEKCDKRHLEIVLKFDTVPTTHDIAELFGEEIFPFISYKQLQKTEWFESNIFDENSKMKEDYKNSLKRLSWVKDFYIGFDVEKDLTWKIYITPARDQKRSLDQLKKIFGDNIQCFVHFIQERYDDGGELVFLKGPKPEDEVKSDRYSGTIGTLCVENTTTRIHYATTCYHVCFQGSLPKDKFEMHELLKRVNSNNSRGCSVTYKYKSGDKTERLGTFHSGIYNNEHDIALIKLEQNLNCTEAINFLIVNNFEKVLLSPNEVRKIYVDMINVDGTVTVGKIGWQTKETKGKLFSIAGGPLKNGMSDGFYRIRKMAGEEDFAKEGDSGSLVYIICKDGRKIIFAYVCYEYLGVYHCANLKSSLKALNPSLEPCLGECGFHKCKVITHV